MENCSTAMRSFFFNYNRFFAFFNIFPRSPICLKIPKRQEAALMMSNEGAPTTRKLNGKRKRREKTGIQREEIGVVEGAEEKVREKSPILIREQILDGTICPLLDLFG